MIGTPVTSGRTLRGARRCSSLALDERVTPVESDSPAAAPVFRHGEGDRIRGGRHSRVGAWLNQLPESRSSARPAGQFAYPPK